MLFIMYILDFIDCSLISVQKRIVISDRETTRWQHNPIYPQPIGLCEYMFVIYDCAKITCVIITHTLYHAHC